jgi:hypothetical protein
MLMTLVTWMKGDQPNRLTLAVFDVTIHVLFLQYLGSILPSNGDSTPLIGEHIRASESSSQGQSTLYIPVFF